MIWRGGLVGPGGTPCPSVLEALRRAVTDLGFGRGLASVGVMLVEREGLGAGGSSDREGRARGTTSAQFHGVLLTVVGKTTCVSGKLSPTFK